MKNRIHPGPGHESVWDFPMVPRFESSKCHIRVVHGGYTLANTRYAFRVVERGLPPVFYISPEDVKKRHLQLNADLETDCKWKGKAIYWDLIIDGLLIPSVAWTYREPPNSLFPIRNYYAFYPGKVDDCFVDGERARPQAGGYYGGWITDNIVGPFKGDQKVEA